MHFTGLICLLHGSHDFFQQLLLCKNVFLWRGVGGNTAQPPPSKKNGPSLNQIIGELISKIIKNNNNNNSTFSKRVTKQTISKLTCVSFRDFCKFQSKLSPGITFILQWPWKWLKFKAQITEYICRSQCPWGLQRKILSGISKILL